MFTCKHSFLSFSVLQNLKYRTGQINWLTPIFSACSSRAICKWDKAKTIFSVSHAGTQTLVCDSLGDSMLPTSSVHTIMYFWNGPVAEDCRGDSPALLKQWVWLWCVCVGEVWVYGLDPLITTHFDIWDYWSCLCKILFCIYVFVSGSTVWDTSLIFMQLTSYSAFKNEKKPKN